jgi:apolipoprotein N-acyltransferase
MVNITNDAWFKETAGPYHLMPMNVFRAVENRVSMARSANTGISGFIDPYGRVMGKVKSGSKDLAVEGYLTMSIPVSKTRTFYTMHGDMFAYLVLLGTAFVLISVLRRGAMVAV